MRWIPTREMLLTILVVVAIFMLAMLDACTHLEMQMAPSDLDDQPRIVAHLNFIGFNVIDDSEFRDHGSMYASIGHLAYSWWGYRDVEDYKNMIGDERSWISGQYLAGMISFDQLFRYEKDLRDMLATKRLQVKAKYGPGEVWWGIPY